MNDPCPVCGLLFKREEGYFLGAMYISYGLSSLTLLFFFFALRALLPEWDGPVVALLALIPYLPLVPVVYCYSRVLWMYYDRSVDPHGALAGSYEKRRLAQIEGPAAGRPACDPRNRLTGSPRSRSRPVTVHPTAPS
jgi:hypothetical protein